VAQQSGCTVDTCYMIFDTPVSIDRIVMQEDQSAGQVVRRYEVDAVLVGSPTWTELSNGTSIGNKKIDILRAPVTVTIVTLSIVNYEDLPIIRGFNVYLCDQITAQAVAESEALDQDQKKQASGNHRAAVYKGLKAFS